MPGNTEVKPETQKITLELINYSLPMAEESLILKALKKTDWNLKRGAQLLGVARGTLYSKMKKYNIIRPFLIKK